MIGLKSSYPGHSLFPDFWILRSEKIFRFLLTAANKFCQRFKLIGQKINYLRLLISIFTSLEQVKLFYNPWVEQNNKWEIYVFFRGFILKNLRSVKLTEISKGTANTIFCSLKTCCLSLVNKISHVSGFNDEIFAKFLSSSSKKSLWHIFCWRLQKI